MSSLAGRIAVVTGASRGIGRAIALAFAAEGASVVATARTTAELESLAAEARERGQVVVPVTADISVEAAIDRIVAAALDRFGHIDILVNNAALIPKSMDLVDYDIAVWREVIEINLTGPALLTRAVLPGMIERRSGKVINISSIGGKFAGKGRTAYRATKAALISLTQCVAAEVKEYGIDVNCICPGGVATEGFEAAFGAEAARRPGVMRPEEIAAIALFLASDASSAITGTAIDAFGATNPIFR
jgi:3-oxoacyl-[acyl-carrier protein] reductase